MILNQRDVFEIPEDIVYLNCAYMSPLPRSVREAGERAVSRKSQPWNIHANDFFEEVETARQLFAELIHTDSEGVALVPSASYGINVAATNLSIAQNQHILLLEEEFPSNVYAWQELAKRCGARVEMIRRPQEGNWTRAILAHINEQTGIVAVPNCYWTDGGLVDLAQIGRRVREIGAALVVDASQSVGAYPLDIAEVQPDFLVTVTYKWLLGPYSLGFLYVAPQHRQGIPLEFTWTGREGSEDFSQLVNYRSTYQPGARRFDMGERSNFVSLPMANMAMRHILQWEVSKIQAALRELTDQIARRAIALGFQTLASHDRVGHIIGLRHISGLPGQLPADLAQEKVFVSVRGDSIRIAPHLYNTAEEVNRLFSLLSRRV
jgi:selenocysteine lyase/cysteine desulfurase